MAQAPSPLTGRTRIQSIDILRGLIMVIMALDHVRDFFHKTVVDTSGSVATGPTDLATTTPVLFFTRWITHFCAPNFVFLAGVSAFLMTRKMDRAKLSAFLVKRGIWLLLVEAVIITFSWTFNPLFNVLVMQVIWAIGASMVLLGLLIWLPLPLMLGLGLLIVFGHNLLDYPSVSEGFRGSPLYEILYHAQFFVLPLDGSHFVLFVYSLLPWLGIMILGYGFGRVYAPSFDAARRRKILVITGLSLLGLFLLLRLINQYGDPIPWSAQPRGDVFSFLSFINVNKYPPSLDFVCITLGGGMLLLWLFEKLQNSLTEFFQTYGRVPMFYYILHFYLIHLLVVIFFFLQGYTTEEIVDPKSPFLFRPSTFGLPLWGVYLVWIFVFLSLYPLCRRYDRYKTKHAGKKWWLSYL